ncbi:VOC family protein [Mobilitalea sibirica]|uniref:VOC family protein n=1 Tax=Mobilitalea sibirica TaxID=1462919 RepID=A0A8J7HB05_9FIRM|nr:VOC family protein [Mobilitalea sibirica]MBH1940541.1 VOC family protein [Mobilitalea sibirica]
MKFHGICLVTEDVIALTSFYEKVLKTTSEGDDIHAVINTEGALLSIYSREAAKRDMSMYYGLSSGSFALQIGVDDVDLEYERLKKLGVEIIKEPTDYSWGNRSMQFKDPDGNIISFACRRS